MRHGISNNLVKSYLHVFLIYGLLTVGANSQTTLDVNSASFEGVLHDNLSNKKRQGSGFAPLILKSYPGANLFRDDAVGVNFEHIFNGAKEQNEISMFTPRHDPCELKKIGASRFQIQWPKKGSRWGMEARMDYDLSKEGYVDLVFECIPTRDLYSKGFIAMMWASYMNRAIDRKIHFWGKEGDRIGWVEFGEGKGKKFEFGTVSNAMVEDLPYERGAETLNLIENSEKKFITPFYYGLIDGDHDLKTTDDRLLYLVLFDQTESIRFAMWNFIKNKMGDPDQHSPAWDWQYVIRNPKVGMSYGYKARVVVKSFKGIEQVWREYQTWGEDLGVKLPSLPAQN
ncbi:MAG: hypothetical protein VX413_01385 [Verrucomicrobiota bacterium]|nr:hypothetical protein [Verrucomicrobiota bacterium]